MKISNKPIYRITICAVLIALSSVLSLIKIFDAPMGGGVTPASMLPLCLAVMMFGTKNGLFTAFVYSVIQLIFGLDNLAYATWWGAAIAIVLLDYIIAYTVLGLSGIFLKRLKNSSLAAALGISLGMILRFICHFVTGITVWKEAAATMWQAVVFSFGYNGWYMLIELILTVILAVLILRIKPIKSLIEQN